MKNIELNEEEKEEMEKLVSKYKPLLENVKTLESNHVSMWELIFAVNHVLSVNDYNNFEEKDVEMMNKLIDHITDNPIGMEYVESVALLYNKAEERRRHEGYRTRSKAGELANIPDRLAVITNPKYQYGVSFYQQDNAWLQQFSYVEGLEYDKENGLRYKNLPATRAELRDRFTNEGIEHIDLPLLKLFYSIIVKEFYTKGIEVKDNGKEKKIIPTLQESITIYLPDLAEKLGLSRNISKNNVNAVVSATSSFQNIFGFLKKKRNGKIREDILPVLVFLGYYEETNTIKFTSPYMNQLIKEIFGASIRRDKKGDAKLKKNGIPLLKASDSFLIESSIAKERNKDAVETVSILVQLIEQTGNPKKEGEIITPHINAENLLQRNVQLAKRYGAIKDNSHKNRLLKTHFTKVYNLLETQTALRKKYKNIKFPSIIPTTSTLKNFVLEFPHEGRKTE